MSSLLSIRVTELSSHTDAILKLLNKSNTTNKILIKAFRNEIKRKAIKVKFIMIIIYD